MEHAQNITQAHKEREGISIECSFTIHIKLLQSIPHSSSSSPYWVIKAMQLSTMMGMSFLLSCCSLRVFPFPPAARWMSEYHREKSVCPMPCRWRVLTERRKQQWRPDVKNKAASTGPHLTFLFPLKPGCPSSHGSRSRRQHLQHKQSRLQLINQTEWISYQTVDQDQDWLSSCRRFRLMISSAAPLFRGQMKRLDFCRTKYASFHCWGSNMALYRSRPTRSNSRVRRQWQLRGVAAWWWRTRRSMNIQRWKLSDNYNKMVVIK